MDISRRHLAKGSIFTVAFVSLGGGLWYTGADLDRYPTVAVEADPSPSGLSMDVSVEQGFTDDHPAHLTITATNVSGSEQTFTFGLTPPFSGYSSEGQHSGLVCWPLSDSDWLHFVESDARDRSESFLSAPIDGCWRLPEQFSYSFLGIRRTMADSESISRTYALLTSAGFEICLRRGDHRFESSASAIDGWGFTVSLGGF